MALVDQQTTGLLKETAMTNAAHYVEGVLLYYAQAQAEYQRTTDRPLRPSPRRSGVAKIRDQFYFILAHSAGMLAAFRGFLHIPQRGISHGSVGIFPHDRLLNTC